VATSIRDEHDQAEIRLLGLILMQSMSIGMAVGIYHAGIWLAHADPVVNGMTYAMGAFAIQGIAYYVFKMFFQQSMDERATMAQMERDRRNRYTNMQTNFEQRRQDMELRMQEQQLDSELRWMEANPGKTPPWLASRMDDDPTNDLTIAASAFTNIPSHNVGGENKLDLGLSFDGDEEESNKQARGADGKFTKKKS
tara:strand:- start:246 stop:833 length:588 start_codon:yes stop_codon:yes gene_type:complete